MKAEAKILLKELKIISDKSRSNEYVPRFNESDYSSDS